MSQEYPIRVPVRIIAETQQELPVPIPKTISLWHLAAGIGLGAVMIWWGTRTELPERLLETTAVSMEEALKERKPPLKPLVPLRPWLKEGMPALKGVSPEMIGLGEMVFAPSIGEIELGRISPLPGIPPVGAVLPTFTALPKDMWLGGKNYSTHGGYGDFEEASAEEVLHFEVALEEAYQDFINTQSVEARLTEGGIEFLAWVQDNVFEYHEDDLDHLDKLWAEGQLNDEWESFVSEFFHYSMHEWNMTTTEIDSMTWEMYPYVQREMDRYGTARHTLALIDPKTQRGFNLINLYEQFIERYLGKPFSVDDINYGTLFLWVGVDDETPVDAEVRRAMSQYLTKSAFPWTYWEMKYASQAGEAGCEAHNCYDPPRSIMDENLQIAKHFGDAEEVECEEVGEYGGSYSYYQDYCYHFAELLKQNAAKGLSGVTWTGAPWELDSSGCGMHVQVKGEWYTVPADEMMEYMFGYAVVPKYLQGKGCPIFVMVTPKMQQAMEQEVLDEEYLQSSKIFDVEPKTIMATIDAMVGWLERNYYETYQKFVETYEQDGAEEANRFFHSQILTKWDKDVDNAMDVHISDPEGDHIYPVVWAINPEGLGLFWAHGTTVGRGSYLVGYKDLINYLYEVGKGKLRVTIPYKPMEEG